MVPNIAGAVPNIDFRGMVNDLSGTIDRARRLQALSGIQLNQDGSLNVDNAAARLLRIGDVEAGTNLLRAGQQDRLLRRQMEASPRAGQGLDSIFGGGATAPAAQPAAPASGDDAHIPGGLLRSESGGRWDAQNSVPGAGGQVGHFGRLQFGQARLQDAARAGIIPAGTTPQAFMADQAMQRRVEQWHFGDLRNFIQRNGYDALVGQQIGGVPVTMDGLLRVAHLGGADGLRRFVETGGRYNPADANGTRLGDYLGLGGGRSAPAAVATAAPAADPAPAPVAAPPTAAAPPAQPVRVASTDPSIGLPQAAPDGTPLPLARPEPVEPASPPPPAIMPPAQVAQAPAAPAPPAQTPQSRLVQSLPGLIRLASDPLLPEGQRQVINTLITQALTETRGTELEREFNAARRGGFDGTLIDFIRARSGPPALQQVTGTDGRTYRGYVVPGEPPNAASPTGGFRIVGAPDSQSPTYRDVRTESGDTVTTEFPADGSAPRPVRVEGLRPGPSATSQQTFDREQAQAQSRRIEEIRTAGQAGRQQIATFDETLRLMNTPGFFSGWGSQQRLTIARALTSVGLAPEQVRQGAASMEAFRAIVNSNVLAAMGGSLGAGVSNADVGFMTNTMPNLENTPEGNRQIVSFLRGVAERRVLVDRFARIYRAQHGGRLDDGFDTALEAFANRNNIQDLMQGRPYRIANDAEFRALPSGTQFVGPDGRLRRVP